METAYLRTHDPSCAVVQVEMVIVKPRDRGFVRTDKSISRAIRPLLSAAQNSISAPARDTHALEPVSLRYRHNVHKAG